MATPEDLKLNQLDPGRSSLLPTGASTTEPTSLGSTEPSPSPDETTAQSQTSPSPGISSDGAASTASPTDAPPTETTTSLPSDSQSVEQPSSDTPPPVLTQTSTPADSVEPLSATSAVEAPSSTPASEPSPTPPETEPLSPPAATEPPPPPAATEPPSLPYTTPLPASSPPAIPTSPTLPVVSSSPSSTPLASSGLSESTTAFAGETASPTGESDASGDSSTNVAAIAAPVVISAILLPLVILLCVWWRRKRRFRGAYHGTNRSDDTEMSNISADTPASLHEKGLLAQREIREDGTTPASATMQDAGRADDGHTYAQSGSAVRPTSKHDTPLASPPFANSSPDPTHEGPGTPGSVTPPHSHSQNHVNHPPNGISPRRRPAGLLRQSVTRNGDERAKPPSPPRSIPGYPRSLFDGQPTTSERSSPADPPLPDANGHDGEAVGWAAHQDTPRPDSILQTSRRKRPVNDDGISELSVSSQYSKPPAGPRRMSDEISAVSSIFDHDDDRDESAGAQYDKRASRRSMSALPSVDEGDYDRESNASPNGLPNVLPNGSSNGLSNGAPNGSSNGRS